MVLDSSTPGSLALTLNWTDNSVLESSNELVQLPRKVTVNTLQFSAAEDFGEMVEVATEAGSTSIQFTVESLNNLAGRVGLKGGRASSLHIRVSSALSNNTPAAYSNVYSMQVTPYSIDLAWGVVLDSGKNDTGKTLYILDEPTTGLHFEDIRILMQVLRRLVDKGNTVIVIEHNMDVIVQADHIIDMGPEGGRRGGAVLAAGTPKEVAGSTAGHTPKYIREELALMETGRLPVSRSWR